MEATKRKETMEEKKLETFLRMLIPVRFSYFTRSGLKEHIGKPIAEIDPKDESAIFISLEKSLALDLKNGQAMEIFTKKAFPILRGNNNLGLKVGNKDARVVLSEIESKSTLVDLLNALRDFNEKDAGFSALYNRIKTGADSEFDMFLQTLNHAAVSSPKTEWFRFENGSFGDVNRLHECFKKYKNSDAISHGEVIVLETDSDRNLAKEIRTGYELPYLSDFSYDTYKHFHNNLDTFYYIKPTEVSESDLEAYLNGDIMNIRKNIMSATDTTLQRAREAVDSEMEVVNDYIDEIIKVAIKLQMDLG